MFGIGSHMPIRKTYWYSVVHDGETKYELDGSVRVLGDVAEKAAEDYYHNHDGWEVGWPLEFLIYETKDGPPVGRFDMEREDVPTFYARERELPPAVAAVDPALPSSREPSTREKGI